jgi:hypothetical protein
VLPTATRRLPASSTEGESHLRDGNLGRVAMVDRFTINMADAQTTLEKFRN